MEPNVSNPVLLTTSQAAQAVGVSSSSLCRFSALGAPCQYTVGGHRRWDIDELRDWIDEQADACEAEQEEEDEEGEDSSDGAEEAETCSHCGAELEPEEDGGSDDDEDDGSSSDDELDADDD